MSNNKTTSRRLTTLIILFPFVTLLLYGGLSQALFFFTQQKGVQKDLQQLEKTLIEAEETNLRDKLENLTQFIRYYDGTSSKKIKNDVKTIINVATDIANNIYQNNKDKVDEATLKELLKNALSDIKFEENIGYLFLLNLKGDVILHVDPKMVGTNIMNIRDVNGKYIVKEFTKVLEKSGEGFVDYYWYIVTENRKTPYYKISFVKRLDAYDWYIGAGEYLKYMTKFTREDIFAYLKENAKFHDGYYFVSNSLNQIIFKPENVQIDKSMLGSFRIEGLYKDDNYLAYTSYVAQYDWYVTAVKKLGAVQENINRQKTNSEAKRKESLQNNLYLMVFTWIVSLLLSLYLSNIINKLLQSYEAEIKEGNEKLIFQSRQALIGELFPMIAHQWRQPINKIASVLALLRFELLEKKLAYEEIDQRCHSIEDNIEFMSETIDDFRTFYKPKENRKEANLKELIRKALDFLQGTTTKKSINIITELENISYRLTSNEFLHVMINLIKNAIDSMSQDGTLIIKLNKDQDGDITISVEDDGKGIEKSKLSKIFDPYFTTKKDSMGIGLYMTKMIVEKHMYGTIEVKRLPQGLKFLIRLEGNK